MAAVRLRVTGTAALRRKLLTVEKSVQQRVVPDALQRAAEPVVQRAKQLCPVDTGKLRKGIHAIKRVNRLSNPSVRVQHSKDTPYGEYVEYGTSRMRAQPHLRPAIDENRERVRRIMSGVIAAGMIRESKR